MKEYAESFYNSTAWKKTRAAYAKSKGGLCEVCLSKGIFRAGEIVHHKIHLTPENIADPSVSLDWDNLCLLCRDCHAQAHDAKKRRYKVDDMGHVTII